MELKEQTESLLETLYNSMMSDLYVEFGYTIERLENEGHCLNIGGRDQEDLADVVKDIFQGSVEDLPKYLEGYAELGKVAAWRLANPDAGLDGVLEAAFGQEPGTDEGLLDALFQKFDYESRMKALNFAYAEASVLHKLFNLYGMVEENKVAHTLLITLPEQVEGWN